MAQAKHTPQAPQAPQAPRGSQVPPHAEVDEADRAMEQVVRFLGILRRRWLVLAVTTAVAVAGSFVAISVLQPRWQASATIVLHLSGPQVLDKMKALGD